MELFAIFAAAATTLSLVLEFINLTLFQSGCNVEAAKLIWHAPSIRVSLNAVAVLKNGNIIIMKSVRDTPNSIVFLSMPPHMLNRPFPLITQPGASPGATRPAVSVSAPPQARRSFSPANTNLLLVNSSFPLSLHVKCAPGPSDLQQKFRQPGPEADTVLPIQRIHTPIESQTYPKTKKLAKVEASDNSCPPCRVQPRSPPRASRTTPRICCRRPRRGRTGHCESSSPPTTWARRRQRTSPP